MEGHAQTLECDENLESFLMEAPLTSEDFPDGIIEFTDSHEPDFMPEKRQRIHGPEDVHYAEEEFEEEVLAQSTLESDLPVTDLSATHPILPRDDYMSPRKIMLARNTNTFRNGKTYNERGYKICGALNKNNNPCQRIGSKCPYHKKDTDRAFVEQLLDPLPPSPPHPEPYNFIPKVPPRRAWSPEEHLLFLQGLEKFGKGNWKEIAEMMGSKSSSQIQIHAQRFFQRQQQVTKTKRSIHDLTLSDYVVESNYYEYEDPTSVYMQQTPTTVDIFPRLHQFAHINYADRLHDPS